MLLEDSGAPPLYCINRAPAHKVVGELQAAGTHEAATEREAEGANVVRPGQRLGGRGGRGRGGIGIKKAPPELKTLKCLQSGPNRKIFQHEDHDGAHEVYNLGAQSHVAVSFEAPEYTADVDAMGTLRLLEAIRFLGLEKKTKFYQASTSELYGLVQETPQKETTPFYPRSPYAVAKLYAYWITINYRESYGMYACNGILFNHESPRRGETFVTRKITRGLSNIAQGLETCLYMGNMDALRDWGHAKDYVRMQWMMLQQDVPEDFVIATGVQYSVRQFIHWSAAELGIELDFVGHGAAEQAVVVKITGDNAPGIKLGDVIVKVDSRYFRPSEVETLLGDPTHAKNKLGWTPEITVQEMCSEMVQSDLQESKRIKLLKEHGYDISLQLEG